MIIDLFVAANGAWRENDWPIPTLEVRFGPDADIVELPWEVYGSNHIEMEADGSPPVEFRVTFGERSSGFVRYDGLGDRASFVLFAKSPLEYVYVASHARGAMRCTVKCADGREGQGCIECNHNGFDITLCC